MGAAAGYEKDPKKLAEECRERAEALRPLVDSWESFWRSMPASLAYLIHDVPALSRALIEALEENERLEQRAKKLRG